MKVVTSMEGESHQEGKDSFTGQQEFVVGILRLPSSRKSSARPMCHSHAKHGRG